MRKVLSLTLIFLTIMITPCYASIIPAVQQSQTKLYVDSQTTVHSPQARYMLTVRPGFTSVNANIIIENTDTVNPIELTMALPTVMENNYTVSQLSVSTSGTPLKIYKTTGVGSPDNPNKIYYNELYHWTVSLNPSERRSVVVNFSTNTKQLIDGTSNLLFPLKQLKLWNGDIDFVEVVADLDYFPAYAFNPNPVPLPDSYADNGRLVWRFYNENFPDEINLSFQPFSSIMNSFFASPSAEDSALTQILRDFDSGNYDFARLNTKNYLLTAPDTPYKNELLFVQALCSIELCYWDEALKLLNDLENKVLYNDTYQSMIHNRIVYEKYYLLYYANQEKAADYIAQIAETTKESTSVFSNWVIAQNLLLNPPIIEEIVDVFPEDVKPEETLADQNKPQTSIDAITTMLKLNQPIEIFTLSLARQFVYLGILALVVIFVFVLLFKLRKPKKKYGKRKKYHF